MQNLFWLPVFALQNMKLFLIALNYIQIDLLFQICITKIYADLFEFSTACKLLKKLRSCDVR